MCRVFERSINYYSKKLVPGAGLEPARPIRARDFKSLVSTNSTIPAAILD